MHFFWKKRNPKRNYVFLLHGGGCSGFKYIFELETVINEDDRVFKKIVDMMIQGTMKLRLLLIAGSFLYLQNAEIDYEENFQENVLLFEIPMRKLPVAVDLLFQFKG